MAKNKVISRRVRGGSDVSIRIVNVSSQMIPIQLAAEGEDFFRGQQQIQLKPGKDVLINEKYLIPGQVDNLAIRGMLKLIKTPEVQ